MSKLEWLLSPVLKMGTLNLNYVCKSTVFYGSMDTASVIVIGFLGWNENNY